MVARQVSSTATNPGSDASRPAVLSYRQHAETQPTSRPTRSAERSDSSWDGSQLTCGGTAAACTPAASFRGRSSNRSPNDPDIARGYGHMKLSGFVVRLAFAILSTALPGGTAMSRTEPHPDPTAL